METPIIDWPLSIQLAGNNIDHANEFLQLLANDLIRQLIIIRQHVNQHDIRSLKNEIHKLLGGLSYSGATRLKVSTTAFYNDIKNKIDITPALLKFEIEALLFIEHVRTEAYIPPTMFF
jgi:HPt (histidine-containing phosphotransfer) domain-containing protein